MPTPAYRSFSQGAGDHDFPERGRVIGSSNFTGTQIPFAVVSWVFAVIMAFLLHGTLLGNSLFAMGGSRKAALFSGIAVNRVRILTFVISGFLAGFAGLLFLGNYETAQAGMGATNAAGDHRGDSGWRERLRRYRDHTRRGARRGLARALAVGTRSSRLFG